MNVGSPATLRLTPNPWKHVALVLLSGGFVVMGAFLVARGHAFGWLSVGLFGLGVVVGLATLVPGASYLELRQDGFEFSSLFRKWFQRWSDVDEFFPRRIATNVMVCWNFAPGYGGQPRGRKLSAGLTGVEAALPDTYGMPAAELAALMNRWRVDARGARSAPGFSAEG